ncbi:adenosylcobinamide-phosphate synthase CbiB [uncultured Desulfovibrio sp.]|uniref:Cobalamin biosynthesis protein CobD n=1 Tax=Candidatus Desulfovibrio intestinavium TaxID=2838534 RepID=A0A9D2KNS8_9BACT|nr:adenosylcobinamide-phosphate synthase CbiB [uncultured Desulfovibrio sp.]HJA77997.1 adenosylcobinamide-phosphate synthase CbiB [Candidatus Desulfovibrio intestinavium]
MPDASLLFAAALLPAALLLDRACGEPPARLHPVCGMGRLADWSERLCREASGLPDGARGQLFWGGLAAVLVILPWVVIAALLVNGGRELLGNFGAFVCAAVCIWCCLAPRCLARHALEVAAPLAEGRLDAARQAVSRMVGRDPRRLDAAGVARACVESVAENLTDGVLATLFWAAVGLYWAGLPAAAALAVLHRCANVLDAMWGHRDARYARFGTVAARLDDALNFLPARLALPAIALAAHLLCRLRGLPRLARLLPAVPPDVRFDTRAALRVGWRFRKAHESPNSAWSEAPFAGALGLQLGGPAFYGERLVAHPLVGCGTPEAHAGHIRAAVALMWLSVLVWTLPLALLAPCF